jgi:signal peptide peptidase SppA
MKAIKTKKNRVAILTVHGVIHTNEGRDGISPESMRKLFEAALADKASHIIIDIHSPGGSPVASAMIHDMIVSIRERGVTVWAHCRDVVASGGYYIVSACDKIYAYESTLIGSIGVILSGFGLDKFIEKHQIEYREITAGTQKSFFNMFKAFKEEDRRYLEELIRDTHSEFINKVFQSRKNDLMESNKSEIITAKVFSGKQALKVGLIDDTKTMREILRNINENLDDLRISRPELKHSFLKKILGQGLSLKLDFLSNQGLEYK